jgi:hypothetical protein
MTFSCLLGLGMKDEEHTLIHNEDKYKPKDMAYMFLSTFLAHEGKADNLIPYYYYFNQFFHATIDPKGGDITALRHFAVNQPCGSKRRRILHI